MVPFLICDRDRNRFRVLTIFSPATHATCSLLLTSKTSSPPNSTRCGHLSWFILSFGPQRAHHSKHTRPKHFSDLHHHQPSAPPSAFCTLKHILSHFTSPTKQRPHGHLWNHGTPLVRKKRLRLPPTCHFPRPPHCSQSLHCPRHAEMLETMYVSENIFLCVFAPHFPFSFRAIRIAVSPVRESQFSESRRSISLEHNITSRSHFAI